MPRDLLDSQPRDLLSDTKFSQPVSDSVGLAEGIGQSALQGATLGFSEEAQSFIAAAAASPFIEDRTFRQLFNEARDSFRADREQFREERPAAALTAEIAGGLATGGAGFAKLGAAKGGALIGGIAGAGFADADEFFSLETLGKSLLGAGVGAAGGKVTEKAIAAIGKGMSRVIGRQIQVFDDNGQLTDEAIAALNKIDDKASTNQTIKNQLVKDGVLTPEQAKRFNLFKKRDIEPTRFNVTQSTDDSLAQQSAAKVNRPVSKAIANQDERLAEIAEEGIEAIGPRAQNVEQVNSNLFSVVDDVVSKADDEVSKAYQAAKSVAQGQPRVSIDNLAKRISENRGSESVSGGVISHMRGVLKNKGLLKVSGSFDVDKRGQSVRGFKKLTVNESEEIRQELNSLFSTATPKGKELIRKFKDALDDDVARAVGEDIFSEARKSKVAFQKLIERGSRNKFDKTKRSFLEDVIDNRIPEEKILTRLLSGRDDDFVKFKNFLLNDAGEEGIQAFNDIKGQALRSALNKAVSTQGKGEGGQAVFNSRLFKNELGRIRNTKKFKQLFNKQEIELIDDIIEIGKLRVPISNVQQGKGPTEVAVDEAKREILRNIPIVGEKARGLIDAFKGAGEARRVLDPLQGTAKRLGG